MTEREWMRLNDATVQLYEGAATGVLASVIAPIVKALIPGETVFTAEVERPRRLLRWWVEPMDCPVQELARVPQHHSAEHPLGKAYADTRDGCTRCTTDVVPMTRFRDTCVYREFFHPLGIDRQLGFFLGDTQTGFLAVGIGRSGVPFSDSERFMSEQLRRHVGLAWKLEKERRVAGFAPPAIEIRLGVSGAAKLVGPPDACGGDEALIEVLTRRELEVLRWMAEGKTDAEIGRILGISRDTARKHAENIRGKLLVENRGAAAALYWRTRAIGG